MSIVGVATVVMRRSVELGVIASDLARVGSMWAHILSVVVDTVAIMTGVVFTGEVAISIVLSVDVVMIVVVSITMVAMAAIMTGAVDKRCAMVRVTVVLLIDVIMVRSMVAVIVAMLIVILSDAMVTMASMARAVHGLHVATDGEVRAMRIVVISRISVLTVMIRVITMAIMVIVVVASNMGKSRLMITMAAVVSRNMTIMVGITVNTVHVVGIMVSIVTVAVVNKSIISVSMASKSVMSIGDVVRSRDMGSNSIGVTKSMGQLIKKASNSTKTIVSMCNVRCSNVVLLCFSVCRAVHAVVVRRVLRSRKVLIGMMSIDVGIVVGSSGDSCDSGSKERFHD